MEIVTLVGLGFLVGVVLHRAFRTALSRQPTGDRHRGKAVAVSAGAAAMIVGYLRLTEEPPIWMGALVLLSAGGLLCLAVELWRGTWPARRGS